MCVIAFREIKKFHAEILSIDLNKIGSRECPRYQQQQIHPLHVIHLPWFHGLQQPHQGGGSDQRGQLLLLLKPQHRSATMMQERRRRNLHALRGFTFANLHLNLLPHAPVIQNPALCCMAEPSGAKPEGNYSSEWGQCSINLFVIFLWEYIKHTLIVIPSMHPPKPMPDKRTQPRRVESSRELVATECPGPHL